MGAQKNPSLTWGGQFHQLDVFNLTLISKNDEFLKYGHFKYNLSSPLKPRSRFLMRSHVVDNKGCRGRDTEFSIFGKYFHLLIISKRFQFYILFIVPDNEKDDSRWSKDKNYIVII